MMSLKSLDRYRRISQEQGVSAAAVTMNLGSIYEQAGLLEQAESYYREFMALDPEYAWAYNSLAYLLIEYDLNVDQGVELARKALELLPDDAFILDTYGWGLYKRGQFTEALETLERAWELLPLYDHNCYTHLQAAREAADSQ